MSGCRPGILSVDFASSWQLLRSFPLNDKLEKGEAAGRCGWPRHRGHLAHIVSGDENIFGMESELQVATKLSLWRQGEEPLYVTGVNTHGQTYMRRNLVQLSTNCFQCAVAPCLACRLSEWLLPMLDEVPAGVSGPLLMLAGSPLAALL
jgi:hypothetical protein